MSKHLLEHLGLGGPCPACEGEGGWIGGWGQFVGCEECGGVTGGWDHEAKRTVAAVEGSGEFVSERGRHFLAWLMAGFEEHERRMARPTGPDGREG